LQALHLSSSRELVHERVQGDVRLLAPAATDGEGVARFPLSPDDDVRDLEELGVADPPRKRLLPFVDRGAEAVPAKVVRERLGGGAEGRRDREDADLLGSEPEREVAGEVRWMTYGVCSRLSSPAYLSPKRRGIWASSWIVPICQERPRTSFMCRSIFGP
jgi:hypothetical protein